MDVRQVGRLRKLLDENRRLKFPIPDQTLDNHATVRLKKC